MICKNGVPVRTVPNLHEAGMCECVSNLARSFTSIIACEFFEESESQV